MGAGRVLGARGGGAAQSRKGSSASAMCQSRTERRRASPPSPVEVRLSSDGGCDGGPAAAMWASPAAPPLRILGPAVEQNGAVGFFNDGSPMSQPWMLPQCSDPTTWYTLKFGSTLLVPQFCPILLIGTTIGQRAKYMNVQK